MAACQRFRQIAINPTLCGNADGVPDGDRTLSESFKSHTSGRLPAVAAATTGTLAVWGMTVHPGARGLYSYVSAIAGSTSSSSITWTFASDDNLTAIESKFIAHRMIGSRLRVYPTSTLSTMNGRWIVMRWPKGYVSTTATTECAPATLAAILDQPYAKRGTANDPDQEGITDFFVGSRPIPSLAANTSGASYSWNNTGSNCDVNEGFTAIWIGTATAGAVQNDMGFEYDIDTAYEGAVASSNLIENPNSNDGDPSLFSAMLDELEAERNAASIYFDANSRLILSTLRGRKLMPVPNPAIADWAEPAMHLCRLRAVLPHLQQLPLRAPAFTSDELDALAQVLRTLQLHASGRSQLLLTPSATPPPQPAAAQSNPPLRAGGWTVV
jgi:hypothetical protein